MKRRFCRPSSAFRPRLEILEDRCVPAGIVNGDFSVSNPAGPGFGWSTTGSASVVNSQGVLAENAQVTTEFSQAFNVPANTTQLSFTIVANNLLANAGNNPPDSFGVALLDDSFNPLIGPVTGLSNTDDFLNIQQTGQVYFASGVSVPGATTSGQAVNLSYPVVVTADMTGVAANTHATLFFDLLGFSPATSSVTIDNVQMQQGNQAPSLTFGLTSASDSGVVGDGITNINPAKLTGTTDPNQTVLLGTSGTGFNDGSTVADPSGNFSFTVTLQPGANNIRVEATNNNGTTTASAPVTFDNVAPTGALVQPTAGSMVSTDPGSVEIQWTDTGGGGLDTTTFGTGNITIPGETINSIQNLGSGLVRYSYGGTPLAHGTVNITLVAGQVKDLAGNSNAVGTQSFILNEPPVAVNDTASTRSDTAVAISVLANDSDMDGTLDTTSVRIVTPPTSGMAAVNSNGTITYTPGATLGNNTFTYTVKDNLGAVSNVAAVTVFVNKPPVAVNDTASTRSDTPVTISVLANDSDVDGTLSVNSVAIVTPPTSGTAAVNANGTITYTPGATLGNNTFTYTVKDNLGAVSNVATVTVFVNKPPVAVNDTASTRSDTPVTISVLANDSDVDGTLSVNSVAIVTPPTSGTAAVNANGTITYTPGTTLGNNTFTYTVKDNLGAVSNVATVTVNVTAHHAPQITTSTGSLTFTENDPARAIDSGLLVQDVDNQPLKDATVQITGNYTAGQDFLAFVNQAGLTGSFNAANGKLTLTGGASAAAYQAALRTVTYVNTSENPSAALRTVTFTVDDGTSSNNTGSATRTIIVVPVNNPPAVAAPASAQTYRNESLVFTGSNLIAFSDVDSGGFPEKVTLKVTRGTLSFALSSGLTFDAGFGNGKAEVHATGTLTALNAAAKSLSYIPSWNTAGADTLQITINDLGHGGGASQTATRTVALSVVARPPVFFVGPIAYSTSASASLNVPASSGVLSKAYSPDGQAFIALLVGSAPAGLTLRPDGSFTFVPQSRLAAAVTFQFRVFDGILLSAPMTVTITVTGPGRGRGF